MSSVVVWKKSLKIPSLDQGYIKAIYFDYALNYNTDMSKTDRQEDEQNPFDFMVDLYSGEPKAVAKMEAYLDQLKFQNRFVDSIDSRRKYMCEKFLSEGNVVINERSGEFDVENTMKAIKIAEADVTLLELVETGVKKGSLIIFERKETAKVCVFHLDGLIQAAFWGIGDRVPRYDTQMTSEEIIEKIGYLVPEVALHFRSVIEERIDRAIYRGYLAENSYHQLARQQGLRNTNTPIEYEFRKHALPRLNPFNSGL